MPADNGTQLATSSLADRLAGTEPTDAPPPPPQMPATSADASTVPPAMPAASTPDDKATATQEPATMAAPVRKADGWEVDSYQLRAFSDAVLRARSYLDAVHAKVDRMQGAELDPQLGTSPVGTQLAKKFDDRLNSTHGLRAMLAEAMKRMDDFVTSAEKAARAYEENEQDTVDAFSQYNVEPPQGMKRG